MSEGKKLSRGEIESRKRTRKLLVQALYQWQINPTEIPKIRDLIRSQDGKEIDELYFNEAIEFIGENYQDLEENFNKFTHRKISSVDPIERAILWIAGFELAQHKIHPNIILNEAIELSKIFGAKDSYKFVNGVLDKSRHSFK